MMIKFFTLALVLFAALTTASRLPSNEADAVVTDDVFFTADKDSECAIDAEKEKLLMELLNEEYLLAFNHSVYASHPDVDALEGLQNMQPCWGCCGGCQAVVHGFFALGKAAACMGGKIISKYCPSKLSSVCAAALKMACKYIKEKGCDYGCAATWVCHKFHACSSGPSLGSCC